MVICGVFESTRLDGMGGVLGDLPFGGGGCKHLDD